MNPMRLRSPLYLLLLSTAVLSACADRSPTGVQTAPTEAPSLTRSGWNNGDSDSDSDSDSDKKKKNNGDSDSDKPSSHDPVGGGPRLVLGNISGDGSSVCRTAGFSGATGHKVDGSYSATIGGFRFTVSGDDKYLSFAQTSTGNVVLGVVVKGGSNTYVYDYGSGATSGSGLRAPNNGGGKVPEISHYTVCYKPKPHVPYTWTIDKKLVKATTMDPVTHAMPVVPTNPLVIPVGETRWIEFEIVVTRSATGSSQSTAAVVDLASGICGTLGAGFVCTSAELGSPLTNKTFNVTGSTKIKVIIDVKNTGAPCAVTKTLTNTVKLTPTGGTALPTASASVNIATPACAPPPPRWTLEKKIRGYWTSMAMGPGDFVPGSTVTFPAGCAAFATDIHAAEAAGCVRWIEYDVIATKIGGGPGDPEVVVFDDMKSACELLAFNRGLDIYCDYPDRVSLPWATFFGTGEKTNVSKTWHYVMDLWHKGDCDPASYKLTNTASLAEPGKPVITAPAHLTIIPGSCTAP